MLRRGLLRKRLLLREWLRVHCLLRERLWRRPGMLCSSLLRKDALVVDFSTKPRAVPLLELPEGVHLPVQGLRAVLCSSGAAARAAGVHRGAKRSASVKGLRAPNA